MDYIIVLFSYFCVLFVSNMFLFFLEYTYLSVMMPKMISSAFKGARDILESVPKVAYFLLDHFCGVFIRDFVDFVFATLLS